MTPKQKVPDEALPVVRDALRMQILSALGELYTRIEVGAALEWEPLDAARALLRELDEVGEVAPGDVLLEALRRQLDTERYLTDTHDAGQRERSGARAALVERVLAAVQA